MTTSATNITTGKHQICTFIAQWQASLRNVEAGSTVSGLAH